MLILYMFLLTVVRVPYVRQHICAYVTQCVSENIGSCFHVADVELGGWNSVIFHDVNLRDQNGANLFSARLLSARISLSALADGNIDLNRVSLYDADINLYKKTIKDSYNFQYIVNMFSSQKSGGRKRAVALHSIVLQNISLVHRIGKQNKVDSIFSYSNVSLEDLNARMSISVSPKGKLDINLAQLSFKEKSGFEVCNMSGCCVLDKDVLTIRNYKISLPQSYLALSEGKLRFPVQLKSLDAKVSDLKANIRIEDLKAFYTKFKSLDETLSLQLNAQSTNGRLVLNECKLNGSDDTTFIQVLGNYDLNNRKGEIENIDLCLSQKNICQIIETAKLNLSNRIIGAIGTVCYNGKALLTPKKQYLDGRIDCQMGSMEEQLSYDVSSKELSVDFNASQFSLSALTRTNYPLDISLNASLHANLNSSFATTLVAIFPSMRIGENTYHHIIGSMSMQPKQLSLSLSSDDDRLQFSFNGSAARRDKELGHVKIQTDLQHIDLCGLPYLKANVRGVFSGKMNMQFDKFTPYPSHGELTLLNAYIKGEDITYHLDSLRCNYSPQGLHLASDIASVDLRGMLTPEALQQGIHYFKEGFLKKRDNGYHKSGHVWSLQAKIYDNDFSRRVLRFPLGFKGESNLQALLRSDGGRSFVSIDIPEMKYDRHSFRHLRLYAEGKNKGYNFQLQTEKTVGKSPMNILFNCSQRADTLQSTVKWRDLVKKNRQGIIKLSHIIDLAHKSCITKIHPTKFMLGDTIWHMNPGRINLKSGKFEVEQFSCSNALQSIKVNGALAASTKDSLHLHLKNISLGYVLDMVNFHSVELDAHVSGDASIYSIDNTYDVAGSLTAPEFYFNKTPMGRLVFDGGYNINKKQLRINANMKRKGFMYVDGIVDLHERYLNLKIKNKNTDIRFLRPYIKGIFSNIKGETSGDFSVFGAFKEIDFSGKQQAHASMHVDATDATYEINKATVDINPGIFSFYNVECTHADGGRAAVEGKLHHRHLKQLTYDVNIFPQAILLYHLPHTSDTPLYLEAYGTGHLRLNDEGEGLNITGRVTPEEGTNITYELDRPDDFEQQKFISFRRYPSERETAEVQSTKMNDGVKENSYFPNIDLLLDVNPKAKFNVIMDPISKSGAKMSGDGLVRFKWEKNRNPEFYGHFEVREGDYKFTMQNVLKRKFNLRPESKITFNGDPSSIRLNMQAIYTVNSASLADLNIGNGMSNRTTKVDCILNVDGSVIQPTIRFDIDLPAIDDEERRMVKKLMDSSEAVNRQVFYLLSVGRFYTPNMSEMQQAGDDTQTSLAMKSFLSSTLSSQVNDILTNALNLKNWTIGTNISTGAVGTNSMEFEGLVSGSAFHNRLQFNGNLGYRDNTYNDNSLLGDFEAQYLLNREGTLRIKAYSNTNDRYFTKSSLTTQGVGLSISKSFRRFKDLFRRKR